MCAFLIYNSFQLAEGDGRKWKERENMINFFAHFCGFCGFFSVSDDRSALGKFFTLRGIFETFFARFICRCVFSVGGDGGH